MLRMRWVAVRWLRADMTWVDVNAGLRGTFLLSVYILQTDKNEEDIIDEIEGRSMRCSIRTKIAPILKIA